MGRIRYRYDDLISLHGTGGQVGANQLVCQVS